MGYRKLHPKEKTELIWHGTLGSLKYITLNCTSTDVHKIYNLFYSRCVTLASRLPKVVAYHSTTIVEFKMISRPFKCNLA